MPNEKAVPAMHNAEKLHAAKTPQESAAKKPHSSSKKPAKRADAHSQEDRHHWIATAAYHRAHQRGFMPGYEMQDWLEAEEDYNQSVG